MMLKRILFALALASSAAQAAEPFASDWAPSAKSRARLIADGAGGAGLQVELSPGAITYWRDPGDAGVPPTFDFAGSENLKGAEVAFPAPARIPESDGGEAFGYRGAVIFPLRVEATDPGRPVVLAMKVDYAVCEKICLPAKAALRLNIPATGPSPFAADFAAAKAATPVKGDAGKFGVEIAALDEKTWRLCLPKAGAPRDLFVEPPQGWWITAKAASVDDARECFALGLRETPADAKFPVAVRATFAGGAGAVEMQVSLAPK